ncbi:hypothetical protein ACJX0J_025620, partial [Zea mays]
SRTLYFIEYVRDPPIQIIYLHGSNAGFIRLLFPNYNKSPSRVTDKQALAHSHDDMQMHFLNSELATHYPYLNLGIRNIFVLDVWFDETKLNLSFLTKRDYLNTDFYIESAVIKFIQFHINLKKAFFYFMGLLFNIGMHEVFVPVYGDYNLSKLYFVRCISQRQIKKE